MKWHCLRITPLFILVFLGFAAHSLSADTLQVLDQQGHPLADAVVIDREAQSQPEARPVIMDQVNRAFLPHVLTITRGQSVSFPNSDDIRHHVYSFSEPHPFEIRLYSGIPSEAVVFERPGVVVLGCNIHDSMEGYILVTDGHWSRVTNEEGQVEWSSPSRARQVYLWHPRQQGEINQLHPLTVAAGQQVVRFPASLTAAAPPEVHSFENHFRK